MRTIFDPVYGSVQISEIEYKIISTSAFQRLQNVKQLGLAHLVFPGANYSRFSHSIGALRNAGKFLNAIEQNACIDHVELSPGTDHPYKLDVNEQQKYRLAALLHDIGHFPFSHATEHAFEEYLQNQKLIQGRDIEIVDDHEAFGSLIINNDSELKSVLNEAGFSPNDVASVFASDNYVSKTEINLKPVISSELDCDRLDYLKRTSHFSGLPFGNVDIDYLISSSRIQRNKLCFDIKAKKSIEHMLLARYYDYQQVVFNKNLISLEWSLKEAIKICIKIDDNGINIEKSELLRMIEDNNIKGLDDYKYTSAIKSAHNTLSLTPKDSKYMHLDAILYRHQARQVFYSQKYIRADDSYHGICLQEVRNLTDKYIQDNGLDPEYFHVWDKKHQLSKVNPSELCSANSPSDLETTEELVHIYNQHSQTHPVFPLVFESSSLLNLLSKQYFSDIRVFMLPFDGYKAHRENLAKILFELPEST
ncbi:HD domain-containing protein [Hydrogenovibrio marinus]|uniref:HD/PDEase domain-containing protein n=1 Tax=Hydrogenovibrio marinus TaxID=28885 RepID=A0A066ZSN9_HYDMR|nr:HD domain-containing protein [Hydrogenovibrio marinus]KDN96512.1 hypothetical protein EI16_09630 [Hydrogenovibrio marinus]BBN60289.1 hypothetical protein HVMH_1883 [Hydrogenovibrio marinus]